MDTVLTLPKILYQRRELITHNLMQEATNMEQSHNNKMMTLAMKMEALASREVQKDQLNNQVERWVREVLQRTLGAATRIKFLQNSKNRCPI